MRNGMGLIVRKAALDQLVITNFQVSDEMLTAHINDGRKVSIPIAWFPRLMSATTDQRQNFEVSPSGYGVHWPEIDEDVSIKSFINL